LQYLTDVGSAYNAIKFLYNDPELRANLGKQGREHVLKLFGYEDFRQKWIELIKTTEKKKSIEFKELKLGEEKGEIDEGKKGLPSP